MEMRNIPNWRKGGASCNVAKNLVELRSDVLCKVELASNKTGYLIEISKQSVEGAAWRLLTVYSKRWEQKQELKKELLSKKQPELRDLEKSQPVHITK